MVYKNGLYGLELMCLFTLFCAISISIDHEVHTVHNYIYIWPSCPCAETGSSRLCWRCNWRTRSVPQHSDRPSFVARRCLWMLSCSSSSWLGCQSRARMRSMFRAYMVWDGIALRCTWPQNTHTELKSVLEKTDTCVTCFWTQSNLAFILQMTVTGLCFQNFHDILQFVMFCDFSNRALSGIFLQFAKDNIKQINLAHARGDFNFTLFA